MPGPTTPTDAIQWAKDALTAGRYFAHEPHFSKRCAQRRVSLNDWRNAIRKARQAAPYLDRTPTQGGANWRIIGPDVDGDELTVCVELFRDHLGRAMLMVTVF